jgi:branched-chain amino acid transport system substrate-binding protein
MFDVFLSRGTRGRHSRVGRRAVVLLASSSLALSFGATSAVQAKAIKKVSKTTARRKTTARPKTTAKKAPTPTTKPGVGSGVAAKPANKGTIRIGTWGISFNPTTAVRTLEETRKIGEVWESAVNASGGINGYRVNVIYKDTAGDSARALAAIKDLDAQGVVALAGNGDSQRIPAILDYINQKKLPVIGGASFVPNYDTHPMLFPVSTNYYNSSYGTVPPAHDVGARHFRNMWCVENPGCPSSVPPGRDAARDLGMTYSDQSASALASDYTTNCISAKNANVDFLQLNGMGVAGFVRDCSRQNYHPIYGVGAAANQATIDALQGEQFAGEIQEIPAFYKGAEVKRFRDAIAKTDLVDGQYTQDAMRAWLGFEMVGAVLKRMDAVNPTRADFLAALYTVKGETLDGQNQPVDYTTQKDGKHAINRCWLEITLKDGKLTLMSTKGEAISKLTWICGG